MGQALCSRFHVPDEGQKRVADSISKLKAYSSYGQVLWFGFGVKHLVRSLCETQQGTTCAALWACLSVSYDNETGARVLSALCKNLLPSEDLSPSLPQWSALLSVCAGALTPSDFPNKVQGFCRLGFTGPESQAKRMKIPRPAAPDALAGALIELSKVSSGSIACVTFQGGLDCGWIAALAEWLLCLRVKVLDREGKCIYWQGYDDGGSAAQVSIVFDWRHLDNEGINQSSLQITNLSYLLPYTGQMPFFLNPTGHNIFGQGRSSWSSVLADTFGDSIEYLLSPVVVEDFAATLMACLECACSLDDPAMTQPRLGRHSQTRRYRQLGFFANAAKRLPELGSIPSQVQRLGPSTSDCLGSKSVNRSIFGNLVLNICQCVRCVDRRNEPWCSRTRPTESDPYPPAICLTIFLYLWRLSRLDIDEAIKPMVNWLLLMYDEVNVVNDDGAFGLFEKYMRHDSIAELSQTSFRLFTDSSSELFSRPVSAVSSGGITIFTPSLEDPSYSPVEQMRFRVVPGNISFHGRLYSEVIDDESVHYFNNTASVATIASYCGSRRSAELIVRETLHVSRLEAWIQVKRLRVPSKFSSYLEDCKDLVTRPIQSQPPAEPTISINITLLSFSNQRILDLTCPQSRHKRHLTSGVENEAQGLLSCPSSTHELRMSSTNVIETFWPSPSSDEWVLIIGVTPAQGALEIMRGDLLLLYSLLSHWTVNVDWCNGHPSCFYFALFDGCFHCLARNFTQPTEIFDKHTSWEIVIHDCRGEVWSCYKVFIEKIPRLGSPHNEDNVNQKQRLRKQAPSRCRSL
ncbi:hypothetical protein MMC12_006099 [Toensbergia leucococca]|nr:hypothetical protein [Toensbergia leucococca]